MTEINTWWKWAPGERFWLGLTGEDGGREMLAVPCRAGHDPLMRTELIHHVERGDIVFHFDDERRAIVACSVPRGRARRRRLAWEDLERGPRPGPAAGTQSGWAVELGRAVPLGRPVTLDELAPVQDGLFAELRALEDRVGEPLYYPFALGNAQETRVVPGHVFKLPSLIVRRFPSLLSAATEAGWSEPQPQPYEGAQPATQPA